MAAPEVRVALHHRQAGPAAQLLQHRQRRAGLHVPACPGVPQVVPAQPGHASPGRGLFPGVAAGLARRSLPGKHGLVVWVLLGLPARRREHPALVLPVLAGEHAQGVGVERNADVLPGLGLVGVDPGHRPGLVDLLPREQPHVGLAQPCGQREGRHRLKVRRQLLKQPLGLLSRQPSHTPGRLRGLHHWRHGRQPAAAVRVMQDGAELRHVPIDGGTARRALRRRRAAGINGALNLAPVDGLGCPRGLDRADGLVGDVGEGHAAQVRAKPAQHPLDLLDGAPVLVLLKPGHDGLVPRYPRGFSEAPDAPEIARKRGGVLLGLAVVLGASAASSALAGDVAEIHPPRSSAAALIEPHGAASFQLPYC